MPPVDDPGLSPADAALRLQRDGFNELPAAGRRDVRRILFEVLRQPMFMLLLAGGFVYLLLGDRIEAGVLLLFASLSVTITLVQESRSEKVLEALRNLASPRAVVVRGGRRLQVAGREVVRGDLIIVGEGDRVAADAMLLTAHDLMLDESLLTGESVPVRKLASATDPGAFQVGATAAPRPGGDDLPMLFVGTLVVRGNGLARVLATGMHSEMGRIGRALGSIETEQPRLQQQMGRFVRNFALLGAVAGLATVVLFGLLRGSWLEALLGGIAIGMSLLPEEFPLVMAVFMAMGAWRISRARVLTRRAAAIEALGATTVLCTDKTGTLTENRMTVVALIGRADPWHESRPDPVNGDARCILDAAWHATPRQPTDPMDVAIHALRLSESGAGTNEPQDAGVVLRSYGLRPDLLAMANVVAHGANGEVVAFAKGAPEAIATLCGLDRDAQAAMRIQVEALAAAGSRVLAVARTRPLDAARASEWPDTIVGLPFEYLGLVAFADPVRVNVPAAVAECRSAGIRVVMLTGDYPTTACAIGLQAGLETDVVVSGDDLDAMSDTELAQRVKSVHVFARIRPEQKLRIVQSLKVAGEIVAMTGDGVNDAPALKAAHIGIAMGGRGTDVAREASSIVLLDDDFGSIVRTIRLGRRIYDNLRKAIEYIVAVHIPIAGIALLPLALGFPLILTPIHIAFLEMVIDPACSVVLEAEEEEDDVMKRPPRDPADSILSPRRIAWAITQGLMVLALLSGLLVSAAQMGLPEADLRALVFTSLVLMNMGLILVNRSFSASIARAFLRPNRSLWVLFGGVSVLLSLAMYWPPVRTLFSFGQPQWDDFGVALGAGVLSLVLLEALKSRWFRDATPGGRIATLPVATASARRRDGH